MSNNQWFVPGGQQQQGYPQQPPSQSGYPQRPSFKAPQPSQGQQSGAQQPGYPQRPSFKAPQPSHQQLGYGQQGFQPVYGPAGQGMPPQPPQNRGNTGLIVALVVVLVAIIAFGAWWIFSRNNQPTANPTSSTQTAAPQETQRSENPPSASTRKSTDPTHSSTTQNKGSGTTSEMPTSFGDFMLDTNQDGASTYKNSNGDFFVAAHGPGETVEANAAHLTDIEKIGKWTCGKDSDDTPMCLTEAHSGTVATLMPDKPFSTLTEISDSFLDAWQ